MPFGCRGLPLGSDDDGQCGVCLWTQYRKGKKSGKSGHTNKPGVGIFLEPTSDSPPPQPKVNDSNNQRGDSAREGGGGKIAPPPPAGSHLPGVKNIYKKARTRLFFKEIESSEAGPHRTIKVKRSMRNRGGPRRPRSWPKQHERQITGKRGHLWASKNRPTNKGPINPSSRLQGSHSQHLEKPAEHMGTHKITLTLRHSTQHFYYHRGGG